jgi:F-type H+-transporting ATPase subunit delta
MAGEEATVSGVAGRYATALFELALEAGAIDRIREELDTFDTLATSNPDLMRVIRSPVFGAEEQTKALTAVLEHAGIGGVTAQFLKVVASNRRLFAVRQIIKSFRTLVARHKGEVTAQVTVAERLNDARLAEIKDALATVTGKDVHVEMHVDPSIIGGLVVKLGSRMVDTSLRTKLNAIKHAMKEAG